jgi:spore coat polysaccharide biosynthesis protein SpsF
MVNQTLAEGVQYAFMTCVAIVQARMGSSRLPGKILEAIAGKSALLWCLDRCRDIPGVDQVVCAVPDGCEDDGVADAALAAGHLVSRGSQDDVLARYAKAAREVGADTVMRITSDCPFIDPGICGQVLALLESSDVDYACNNMPPKFPHGLDCDAFSSALLLEAERCARDPYEREHVTPWLRRHRRLSKACLRGPGGGLERLRWTLDYPQDLAFFRACAEAFGEGAAQASAAQWAALCLRRPDLAAINAAHIDATRLQDPASAPLQTAPMALGRAA